MTTARRRSLLIPVLILAAMFLGVAALDDPQLHDPQPGPSALTLPPHP